MDKVKEYAKSLATFIATIVINMVISMLQGEQPWPQTQEEWIRYLGTAFTAALATAIPRNKITQGQLDTAKQKGEIVGHAVVVPKAERTPAVAPASELPTVTAHPIPQQPEPELPVSPLSIAREGDQALSIIDQIIAEKRR